MSSDAGDRESKVGEAKPPRTEAPPPCSSRLEEKLQVSTVTLRAGEGGWARACLQRAGTFHLGEGRGFLLET